MTETVDDEEDRRKTIFASHAWRTISVARRAFVVSKGDVY